MVKIGGFQKVTLLDYPGKIAATIFFAGCNFRCGFCHNPDLVEIKAKSKFIPEKEVLAYLKKRQGLLEAVCLGGGEPLLQTDLGKFLAPIKTLDYLIKIDTNGFNFKLLKELIAQKLIDYIAMDIKSGADNYQAVTNSTLDFKNIKESIKVVMSSGLPYEFRTTILPKFHDLVEIEKIAKMIEGADNYFLQNFRNRKTLDPSFKNERAFTDCKLAKLRQVALKYVKNCQIRN